MPLIEACRVDRDTEKKKRARRDAIRAFERDGERRGMAEKA